MTSPHDAGAGSPVSVPTRSAQRRAASARRQLDRYVWALHVLWTMVVGASLTWNIVGVNQETRKLARLRFPVAQEEAGTIRGAPRVSLPAGPLWALARRQRMSLLLGHGLIWLVGMIALIEAGRRLRARRDALDRQNAQLAQRSGEVQEAYRLLDQELKAVAQVQVSLLPARIPDIPGFEVVTHYSPAGRAGGDYFDFLALPDGRWAVLIADVSGHGAPAAVVMAMMRVVFHTLERTSPPDRALADVNAVLCRNILSDHFVTCCYGILDPAARTFAFASAGHLAPLFFDQASRHAYPVAMENGLPLGVDLEAQYAATTVDLPPASLLTLYTDGVTEAFSPTGEQFGTARLTAAIEAQAARGVAVALDAILAALDAHRNSVDLTDDTALILFRALA